MKDKFKIFGLMLCITATLTMAVSCQKDEPGGPTSTYTKDGNNGQIQTPTPDSLIGTTWKWTEDIYEKGYKYILTFTSLSDCKGIFIKSYEESYDLFFTYEYNSPYGRMITSDGSICDFKVEGNRMFLSYFGDEFWILIRQ